VQNVCMRRSGAAHVPIFLFMPASHSVLQTESFATADIKFAYQDGSMLVINKPSGLLSVPGRGSDKQDCASSRVQALFADALIVHRLDMATSGLMVMARGIEAQRQLSIAFRDRAVCKRYIALVAGHVKSAEGLIDLPLMADWPNRPRKKVDLENGKPSITRYTVLQYNARDDMTRVALEPVTGRSHQLRVHMQALGHAIVGDALYASELVRDQSPRLMLHAQSLIVPHPLTAERMCFISEAPF
ncbi:MAG TPA: pseudouridine synthase, partial [Rhodocyclaceae bacterium]|nr:pseudouridine synthase [Rhodocyclaceae bacterium]